MRVLVTGADGSLGKVLCDKFSGHWGGDSVTGIYNFKMKEGKTSIDHSIDHILEYGSITHVINNFGINHLSWIGTTGEEDQAILMNNVMAPYWVINHLVKRGQVCRVINVASATYRVAQRCTTLYCASKAAMVQMTKVMARELAPKGWVINAIAPGMIEDTLMSEITNEQVKNLRRWDEEKMMGYALNLIPAGRPTTTAEVAEAIYKMFELPDYINGTVIDMMGGV